MFYLIHTLILDILLHSSSVHYIKQLFNRKEKKEWVKSCVELHFSAWMPYNKKLMSAVERSQTGESFDLEIYQSFIRQLPEIIAVHSLRD